jgi:hypothetical protein
MCGWVCVREREVRFCSARWKVLFFTPRHFYRRLTAQSEEKKVNGGEKVIVYGAETGF